MRTWSWCVVALVVSGCVTTQVVDDVPPKQRAMGTARQGVVEARAGALELADGEDSYALTLRYNAGRCGAPPFEVWARGRWERVWVDADTQALSEDLERWSEGASARDVRALRVRFEGEERGDERGASWPVVVALGEIEPGGEVAYHRVATPVRAECDALNARRATAQ